MKKKNFKRGTLLSDAVAQFLQTKQWKAYIVHRDPRRIFKHSRDRAQKVRNKYKVRSKKKARERKKRCIDGDCIKNCFR